MFKEVLPLRQASRELIRELGFLESFMEPLGITHSQAHALIELEARGAMTQIDLAAILRLDKSRASRVADEIVANDWAKKSSGKDGRTRVVEITKKGREKIGEVHDDSNARVESALSRLDESGRDAVVVGMWTYARALAESRRRSEYEIRAMKKSDNASVAKLIRTVMPEFGAKGPGFAIMDPEVDDMFGSYNSHGKRAEYFVIVQKTDGEIKGAGGFAPLIGGDKKTCELRKMYLYSELRGIGFGREILERCIRAATKAGFSRMYLETLTAMSKARALYEKAGFTKLKGAVGATGHHGCDSFYELTL